MLFVIKQVTTSLASQIPSGLEEANWRPLHSKDLWDWVHSASTEGSMPLEIGLWKASNPRAVYLDKHGPLHQYLDGKSTSKSVVTATGVKRRTLYGSKGKNSVIVT